MQTYMVLLVLAGLLMVSHQEILNSNPNILELLEKWRKIAEPYNTQCMCQTGVKQVLLDRLWKYGEVPDDACFKCTLRCWFQQIGFMNPKGVMDIKEYLEKIAGVDAAIANKCGKIEGVDLCQKSYDIFTCAYRILIGVDPHPDRPKAWDPVRYLLGTSEY